MKTRLSQRGETPVPRVLLIDDELAIRTLVRLVLEGAGMEVAEAGDGQEGVRAFHRFWPDLVLCDLLMPNKDGIETIRQLQRDAPDVKIIAMSGGGLDSKVNLLPMALALG